jgi:hypothetical protein
MAVADRPARELFAMHTTAWLSHSIDHNISLTIAQQHSHCAASIVTPPYFLPAESVVIPTASSCAKKGQRLDALAAVCSLAFLPSRSTHIRRVNKQQQRCSDRSCEVDGRIDGAIGHITLLSSYPEKQPPFLFLSPPN